MKRVQLGGLNASKCIKKAGNGEIRLNLQQC